MSVRSPTVGQRSRLGRALDRVWPGAEAVPTTDLTQDELFAALKVERRRLVVRYVVEELEAGDYVEFGDLVDWVTAEIHDIEPRLIQGKKRKNVYVALKQEHVPRLEAKGVVTVDRDVIREGPNAEGLYYQMETSELVTGTER